MFKIFDLFVSLLWVSRVVCTRTDTTFRLVNTQQDFSEKLKSCKHNHDLFNEVNCTIYKYLDWIMEKESQSKNVKLVTIPGVSTLPEGATYVSVFEDYIVPGRSFKMSMLNNSMNIGGLVDQNVVAKVPLVAANNYLRRSELGTTEYFHPWPETLTVLPDEPMNGFCCPAEMHRLVWAVDRSLSLRVFSVAAQQVLQPLSHELKDQRKIPLHIPKFDSHGFTAELNEVHRVGQQHNHGFAQVRLDPGEFLFVPAGHAVSAQQSDSTQLSAVSFQTLCMVDASNLNDFRSHLRFTGLVSAPDRALLSALAGMDTAMNRFPTELSVEEYLSTTTALPAISAAAESGSAEGSAPRKRSDRRKKGGGGGDFRDQ